MGQCKLVTNTLKKTNRINNLHALICSILGTLSLSSKANKLTNEALHVLFNLGKLTTQLKVYNFESEVGLSHCGSGHMVMYRETYVTGLSHCGSGHMVMYRETYVTGHRCNNM